MVNFPFASSCDDQTPQRQETSNPAWSTPTASMSPPALPPMRPPVTPRIGKTPRKSGLPSARSSPYMSPDRVIISDGSPMVLFTPKQHMAQKEAQRRRSSNGVYSPSPGSMGPPTQLRGASSTCTPTRMPPPLPLFPSLELRRKLSTTALAPAAVILGTPKPERRLPELRPPVELLQVLTKCVESDTEKDVQWTLRNGLMNGRSEDRDRSRMWAPLFDAINIFWPDLRTWIMHYTPSDNNTDWFIRSGGFGGSDSCIDSRDIASRYSSLDRVGFNMSSTAYSAACGLIRTLVKRRADLQCLVDNRINPFFIIYACADCDVRLPDGFSRQLLWKHLDATIRAECWRGLGSNRAHESTSSGEAPVLHGFSFENEDPEKIIPALLSLSLPSRYAPAAVDSAPVHRVQIVITGYQWVVKAPVGTLWYQAGDMDDKDIASFAVIDALTRLLPHCREGILEIHTNDIRLLWGAYGAPSGAWVVVWAVCKSHGVRLRVKWAELAGLDARPPTDRSEKIGPIPQRDGAVVDAVVDKIRRLEGSAAYECMTCHLTRVTG